MKLTLKLPDNHPNHHQHHHDSNNQPILKAKLPLTILNHPFLSTITSTTTTPSDLTFSLSTNFPSGPSLKLTYCPTTTACPPFSLSFKSGIGLFGSPHNSSLLFSARFSLFNNPTSSPQPIFFLHFKPQFGHFSLSKTTSSSSNPRIGSKVGAFSNSDSVFNHGSGSGSGSGSEKGFDFKDGVLINSSVDQRLGDGLDSNGVVQNLNGEWNSGLKSNSGTGSVTGSSSWEEVKLVPVGGKGETSGLESNGVAKKLVFQSDRDKHDDKGRVYSGIAVRARTVWPITKRLVLNFNWGVNLPSRLGSRMPYLTVDKMSIERTEEGKVVMDRSDGSSSSSRIGNRELLKGLCLWMERDLELLQEENREMKELLEDMKTGVGAKNGSLDKHSTGRRAPVSTPLGDNGGDFEAWRSKRNGKEENGREASRIDVENQLRKAIKSAST